MATGTLTRNKTLPDSSSKEDFHDLVDTATVEVTEIVNTDISLSAAISATKLAQITTAGKVSGAALTSLANIPAGAGTVPVANIDTGTTANKIVKLDSSAKIPAIDGSLLTSLNPANLSAAVAIANGGTGQTTAQAARNALLPDQSSSAGKFLKTDGTNVSWAVTSTDYAAGSLVEASAPTDRTTSSTSYVKLKEFSPLMRAGTITISFTFASSGNAAAKVYKSNVAVGGEKTANGTYTENFTVAVGDIFQVYAKKVDADPTVSDFKILVSNPTVPTEQTDY